MTDQELSDVLDDEQRKEEPLALAMQEDADERQYPEYELPTVGNIPEDELNAALEAFERPERDANGLMIIRDEVHADWCVRQHAKNALFAAHIDAVADAWIARINGWREDAKARYIGGMDYLQACLYRWFTQQWRKKHTREKSCPLPSGVVGERAQSPQVYQDEARLLLWAKENGHGKYVKVKETVDWAGLKHDCDLHGLYPVLKSTGEVIDAVTLEHREPAFYVKPADSETQQLEAEEYKPLSGTV